MQVYVVGMREGSSSMSHALARLGIRRVYGMGRAVQYHSHLHAWARHGRGTRPIDFASFFARWDGAKAHPAMFYPEQMLAAFPDVKVILLHRDDDAWFRSYCELYRTITRLGRWGLLVPRLRAFHDAAAAVTFARFGRGVPDNRDAVLAARRALQQRVRELVSADQLLEFDVRDGWEPLCRFLDRPVPDEPFPWRNKGRSAIRRALTEALLRDAGWAAVTMALGAGAMLHPVGLALFAVFVVAVAALYARGWV